MRARQLSILVIIFCMIHENLSTLRLISPDELTRLFPNKEIKAAYSDFGQIPYGFYTRGRIYYDTKDKIDDYACNPINDIILTSEPFEVDYYPIIMVDRGSCTFVTKTRNVQNMGGHLALIVNNEPGAVDDILMVDDGTGSDIYIPAVLISQEDGKKIEDFIIKNKDKTEVLEKVAMEVEFIIEVSDKVNYEIFFSSSDRNVYKFMKEFYPFFKQFGTNVLFTPHYVVHKSPFYGSDYPEVTEHCVSNGLYCQSPKPEEKILNGSEVILQDLYQLCVYSWAKRETVSPYLYWDYMGDFFEKCLDKDLPDLGMACSNSVISQYGVDPKNIEQCVADSFGAKEVNKNTIQNANKKLAEEYAIKSKYEIKIYPTTFINKKQISGRLSADGLFQDICTAFDEKPTVCASLFYDSSSENGISWISVIVIIIMIILFNCIIIVICRKYIITRIHERIESGGIDIDGRINNVVANYLSLRETK